MASAEIGSLRVRMAINAGEFVAGAKRAGRGMAKLGREAKLIGASIAAAFTLRFVSSGYSKAIDAYSKQAAAIRAVEATLKSTGAAAGFTSKQLQKMASGLQENSIFGDEDILSKVTNNLLTFGNVVGPVFERAQGMAANLSQVLNQDLQSSAIQLGKALNNPVEGITALSRVGIAFTTEQKKTIREMMLANDVMGAQGVILDELERYYGGAAAAAAKGSGIIAQSANSVGDAWEHIGKALFPIAEEIARIKKSMAEWLQTISPKTLRFVAIAGTAAAAITAVAASAGVLAAALAVVITPIGLLGVAVAGAAALIATNWRGVTNVTNALGDTFHALYKSAKKWLVDAFKPVADWFMGAFRKIGKVFNSVRSMIGLDAMASDMDKGLAEVKKVVGGHVATFMEIWNRGADEAEKAAPELAPKMIKPMLTAADLAALAATKTKTALTDIEKAQKRLVDQGVAMAEGMKSPYAKMLDDLTALRAAHGAGAISGAQFSSAQTRSAMVTANAYGSMAQSIVGDLSSAFGDSKGMAIASALINTYQSVTNAMANIPAPFNFAAAAASMAAGMAQVMSIKSTNSNSKTPRSGSTGGAAGAAAVGSSGGSSPSAGGGDGGSRHVDINFRGASLLPTEAVIGLIEQINEVAGDGLVLRGQA